ncbi:hypothetical protein X977_4913 [Burkholderia pseudomallei MSHR7504]|nr:hypothetical protein X977_4913 [Burkholderia pseudomallei MSHR7504]OMW57734.1 hypothetical protein AQ810_07275 [Burkholderia pseudomallei]
MAAVDLIITISDSTGQHTSRQVTFCDRMAGGGDADCQNGSRGFTRILLDSRYRIINTTAYTINDYGVDGRIHDDGRPFDCILDNTTDWAKNVIT